MAGKAHEKGHRWVAFFYDWLTRESKNDSLDWIRAWLAGEATGSILEIGAGTGANFRHYHFAHPVTAVEPDKYMRKKALRRLNTLGISNIDLGGHPAESLPYPDESFDAVVCTFVLCSVKDINKTLSEIRRVLKPQGRLRFAEHVRGKGFKGKVHDAITPGWSRLTGGCHLNRDTRKLISDAGFKIETLLELDNGRGFLPTVAGLARKDGFDWDRLLR